MPGIFLSYAREDAGKARSIALALEKAGHNVWWDLHVRGGAQFAKVIEEALKAADAVVVLWTTSSVESPWVRDEASAGRDGGRLIPVTLDGTEPPLGFRQFHTIDLTGWSGRGTPAGLRALLAHLETTSSSADRTREPETKAARLRKDPVHQPSARMRISLAIAAFLALVAVAGIYWRAAFGHAGPPRVEVNAADASQRSQQLARDLLVSLGNLHSVKSGSMTLVNTSDHSSSSDLLFQAADTSNSASPSATLALLNGSDHGVLWSADFAQPSGNGSDLRQQLAFTAGRVLDCALDGLSQGRLRQKPQVLLI